ncbi:YbhB/YbcL family Raf kinase inhibitor-like protein [Azospirillum sp. ST 5-10]|uniref:YbhB/YbcL family Raf kinase inhibitor-like protein n=1 Tax=unclassified Azospirillum TaxID=2630922 RepID=UPI003F4A7643
MHGRPAGLLLAATALAAAPALAQSEKPGSGKSDTVEIVGHILEPQPLDPTPDRTAGLTVPDGFRIERFADGLANPRMLAVAGDGTVYVTRREVGDVVMLRDEDGDGRADRRETVASRPGMHGIAVDGDRMYLATVKDVYAADIHEDGRLGELEHLIDDLPDGGQHPNRTLAVGPDGMLYVSVGSTCNACAETNPENATILRVEPDGSRRTIVASGLRNTIGFGWQPETGQMWGMDHGIDWLGDDEQPEELNRIVEGAKYGWPYVYADGTLNPADEPPGGIPPEQWAAQSEGPVLTYTAHAAPMQMAFHTGDGFPAAYRGDAFVAMRGSWNRTPPSGYEVVRIDFENGEPRRIEPFVGGFLVEQGDGYGQLGRLAGVAVAPDGSLLFSDDRGGVIYRVRYDGPLQAQAGRGGAAESSGASASPSDGSGSSGREGPEEMAIAMLDAGAGSLEVESKRFRDGARIPNAFSEYGQGISPPLSWSEVPAGTVSFAIVVEDPDAGPKPFVHWLAYNIPADVRSLREGMPTEPRLTMPDGVLQGVNSHGSTGYFGMKPPDGDPPHTYHFQVFALDTTLDLPPGADRAELVAAMKGHVLAQGQFTGTFRKPGA